MAELSFNIAYGSPSKLAHEFVAKLVSVLQKAVEKVHQ